jgi:hypothetical protein
MEHIKITNMHGKFLPTWLLIDRYHYCMVSLLWECKYFDGLVYLVTFKTIAYYERVDLLTKLYKMLSALVLYNH